MPSAVHAPTKAVSRKRKAPIPDDSESQDCSDEADSGSEEELALIVQALKMVGSLPSLFCLLLSRI